MTDIPGTTRELLYDTTTLARVHCEIIDSPGLLDFQQEMVFLRRSIAEADILLFVVDGKQEMGMKEQEIHKAICAAGKQEKTILVVNKLDGKIYTEHYLGLIAPWYEL